MQDTLEDLNPEQKAAVTHQGAPLLIIAGAGTGKTTVITRRMAQLLSTGAACAEEIVALTFTEKAAHEMEDRIGALLESSYTDIFIGTFHAFCQKILEEHGIAIGLPTPFKLYTPAQSYRLVKEHFDRFTLDYYRPKATPTRFIYALLTHFSRCKDELITPEKYLAYAEELHADADLPPEAHEKIMEIARVQEVADAYHTYTQLMLENGALDFGDLLLYTNRLFEQRPNILHAVQKKYRHILVDEFQDTNGAQYQLLKKLAEGGASITVVGDDDQSIYRWRGASISNILQFTKDFLGAKTVVLTSNYRSRQEILDTAYQVIWHNNPNRLEIAQKINKKLKAEIAGVGNVTSIEASTGEEEARLVARDIIAYHEKGSAWSDCAILARANAHLDTFVQALQLQGIPYQYQAATGLFKTPIILDCLAMLRVVSSFYEHNAMYRVLQLPKFRLSPEDQSALWLVQKKNGCTLFEALGKTLLAQELISFMRAAAQLAQEKPVGVVLLFCLETSDYLPKLTHAMEQGDNAATDALLHLKSFFEIIERFGTEHPEPKTDAFISYMQDLEDAGEEGSLADTTFLPTDAVQLSTIHSAKGLEFKHVFVVNLVERRFPSDERKEAIVIPDTLITEIIPGGDHHQEEERRLFYVAATRAKESLTLTSAAYYGGVQKRKPSRFLIEAAVKKQEMTTTNKLPFAESEPAIRQQGTRLPKPKYYSYSQLKTYETCPLQYKFAHVLGIPTYPKPALTFGSTMHRTLQKFYERVQELNSVTQPDLFSSTETATPKTENSVQVPTSDELFALYTANWNGDWFQTPAQKEEYFEEGKRMLQSFYSEQTERGWRVPAFLERGFSLRVGAYTLRGKIDRVDVLPEGGLVVIDYKTGKPKDRLTGEDKEQLFLYQIAAQDIPVFSERGRVVSLTFYYLEDGSTQSFVGTPEQLADYKHTVCTTIAKIEAGDFKPKPSQFTCGSCPYKDICEFRQ